MKSTHIIIIILSIIVIILTSLLITCHLREKQTDEILNLDDVECVNASIMPLPDKEISFDLSEEDKDLFIDILRSLTLKKVSNPKIDQCAFRVSIINSKGEEQNFSILNQYIIVNEKYYIATKGLNNILDKYLEEYSK